jgi:hypothetical protein
MAAAEWLWRRPIIPHIAFISLPQKRYPFPAIAPQLIISKRTQRRNLEARTIMASDAAR